MIFLSLRREGLTMALSALLADISPVLFRFGGEIEWSHLLRELLLGVAEGLAAAWFTLMNLLVLLSMSIMAKPAWSNTSLYLVKALPASMR
ncbi:MAG: hypothetical protein U5L72_17345 [Bacteroidales bacterium]|nr:hypothetical protein [Bacteroidales bacterium]